jgi:hypothetical protein
MGRSETVVLKHEEMVVVLGSLCHLKVLLDEFWIRDEKIPPLAHASELNEKLYRKSRKYIFNQINGEQWLSFIINDLNVHHSIL